MAASYRNRFLAIMRSLERELDALFTGLSDESIAILIRAANVEGIIETESLYAIQQNVGAAVMRRFVGRTGQGTMAPFIELPTGDIFPLAQYSRILISHTQQVEALAIEQQRGFMLKFTPEALRAQLQQTPLFRPNPLAQYDKLHTWIDSSGYQLSDRIWRTAGTTRRQLDAFLDDAIRRGRGTLDLETRGATGLAKDLELFLKPGRSLRRTKAPYGVDASYDAMRLARTEISRAHAAAFENAAKQNPFVDGLVWNLSGSHPKADVCDQNAGGPYPLDNHPAMPAHPQCLCYWSNHIVEDKTAVFNEIVGVTA